MKKQIILPIVVFCVCIFANLVSASKRDPFEKFIVNVVEIEHPIFEKVFPGVVFKEETLCSSRPMKRTVTWIGEEKMFMPGEFNRIYAQAGDTSVSSYEMMEAYIRLTFWGDDPELKIVTQEEVSIKHRYRSYNYRVVVDLDRGDYFDDRQMKFVKNIVKMELVFLIENDQIIEVLRSENGKPIGSITPVLINSTDNIELH